MACILTLDLGTSGVLMICRDGQHTGHKDTANAPAGRCSWCLLFVATFAGLEFSRPSVHNARKLPEASSLDSIAIIATFLAGLKIAKTFPAIRWFPTVMCN